MAAGETRDRFLDGELSAPIPSSSLILTVLVLDLEYFSGIVVQERRAASQSPLRLGA